MMTLVRHHATLPARVWPEDRVDRAFGDIFRNVFAGGAVFDRLLDDATHQMRLEEYVEDGTCVIRAEMPGIDPDKDVEITVADGVLRLRAMREERKEEDRPDGYHSEFHYGSFERSVTMPEGATEADVTASYKDGVLEVRVPVAQTPVATPIKVPIQRS